jgi:hypothetical protein
MEAVARSAAYDEAIVFLGCFRDFPDPRQRGKVIYPLQEVLLLCLLSNSKSRHLGRSHSIFWVFSSSGGMVKVARASRKTGQEGKIA